MRNPSASSREVEGQVNDHLGMVDLAIQKVESDPSMAGWLLSNAPDLLLRSLRGRHNRGDSIDQLRSYFLGEMPDRLARAQKLFQACSDRLLVLTSSHFDAYLYLFAMVCFADEKQLNQPEQWINTEDGPYLFDLLLKAFVPTLAFAKTYGEKENADPRHVPVIDALLGDAGRRAAGLAAFMKNYAKLMKRYGYRETPDPDKHMFDHTPFHVGLAVCAWDIDDTAFRDHPYYPRELVDYYRTNVRHTRDAWRPLGRGADGPFPVPPHKIPKPVYALKPGAAYVRWLELVCAENPDAVAGVRKELRNRKTMPPLFCAMTALGQSGHGLQVDIKDDETLAFQIDALVHARGLPPFPAPADPPQGPARASALLRALASWLPDHGYELVMLDDGSDTWHAVAIHSAHASQFKTLCEQLGVEVCELPAD